MKKRNAWLRREIPLHLMMIPGVVVLFKGVGIS